MASDEAKLSRYFRPILLVSELLGLTFVSSRLQPRIIFCYRLVIFGLLIATLVLQLPVIMFWVKLEARDLDSFLQFSKISIAWTNYFINFLMTVYQNGRVRILTKEMSKLSLKLDDSTLRKLFYGQIKHIAVNFGFIIGFQHLAVHLTDPSVRRFSSAWMYIFLDGMTTTIIIQFVESVLLVREYFKCLNIRMSKLQGW